MNNFDFSIVMAVYNVEKYLCEAIDSITKQSAGFDKIQIILVDDGSTDGSGKICDEYKEKYPDNIVVIHKENGGVSSARNAGIKEAKGKYINFMDADDYLSEDTVLNVKKFFDKNSDEIDLVSIPIVFFEGQTGDHILNFKFSKGSRIIDVDKEWKSNQNSISSVFIKRDVLGGELQFDEHLKISEDSHLVQKILLRKHKYGVVSDARYMYRRREGGSSSAMQGSIYNKAYYNDWMDYYAFDLLSLSKEKCGYIPKFIQFVIAYDIQWRLKEDTVPKDILSEDEEAKYKQNLRRLISMLDEDVILGLRNIYMEYKLFMMGIKYGDNMVWEKVDSDYICRMDNTVYRKLSEQENKIEFVNIEEDKITIEGTIKSFPSVGEPTSVYLKDDNGNEYKSECRKINVRTCLGEELLNTYMYKITVPSNASLRLNFYVQLDVNIRLGGINYGTFSPIGREYSESFYEKNGTLLRIDNKAIVIEKLSKSQIRKKYIGFYKQVWKKNLQGGRKAILARLTAKVTKRFHKKPVWIISDRVNKAGDNGEAFFKYVCENHKEIDAYFVISKDAKDYEKMRKIGKVLPYNSWSHKMKFLMADYVISSQGEVEIYNPFRGHSAAYRDILSDVKFIFLQHGITKDDQSRWLNRLNKNIYGFVCAAKPEYESLLAPEYLYEPEKIWLTGFPRFDHLSSSQAKTISIMPTWRQYLMGKVDPQKGLWTLGQDIENSDYVKFFHALLNSEKLILKAQELGYKIRFIPHPNLQPYKDIFDANEYINVVGTEVDYKEIFADSSLVVTDYSSAVFDFAYLKKPVVYAQFDRDVFWGGNHVYSKGYFDYHKDGFGKVALDLDSTVEAIVSYMENGCQMEDKYKERATEFFAYSDKLNCQRVYNKLTSKGESDVC